MTPGENWYKQVTALQREYNRRMSAIIEKQFEPYYGMEVILTDKVIPNADTFSDSEKLALEMLAAACQLKKGELDDLNP
jgi:hypothetical protein